MLAETPQPPYYAAIFSSIRTPVERGYSIMNDKLFALVTEQEGFLGVESAREEVGITVSYWKDLESIKRWKENAEHLLAQKKGKSEWYQSFKVRIANVERDYEFEKK